MDSEDKLYFCAAALTRVRVPLKHLAMARIHFKSKYDPFVLISLSGVLARLPFYLAYKPIWSSDSWGYSLPYFFWINHDFYLGERTPGYPLFLGLTQWLAGTAARPALSLPAAYTTVCLQSLLDVLAASLLYYALAVIRVRRSIALVSALFAVTIPGLCNFEMNILNISLAFFCLTLAATAFAIMMRKLGEERQFIGASVVTGLLLSCAGLVRPENLVFLAVLAAAMIGISLRSLWSRLTSEVPRRLAVAAVLMLVSAAPLVLAWMTWNYVGIGEFRITTLTGWNRSKTVYNMFDRVGPEDRLVGEILSSSYRQRNSNGRIVRDHVWQAQTILGERYWEMPIEDSTRSLSAFHQKVDRIFEDVLGMKFRIPCDRPDKLCTELLRREVDIYDYRLKVNLGNYVGKVSWKLIRKYPGSYLYNVADNFVRDTFNFRYVDARSAVAGAHSISLDGKDYVKNRVFAGLVEKAVIVQAPLLSVLYFITIGFVLSSPLVLTGKAHEHAITDATVTLLAMATVGTFVATCMLSGFNKEYSAPHLGVLVICGAYAVENRARIAAAIFSNRPAALRSAGKG